MRNWFILLWTSVAAGLSNCPSWMLRSGIVNDLGKLSDIVSWDGGFELVHGVCGEYHLLTQTEGIYDTRMRIYEKTPEEKVVVFRPTQQTSAGGDIHVNRQLVPTTFLSNATGLVHDRFQQAFQDLIQKLPERFIVNELKGKKVYVTGHSLGGSFQLFMALYLWKEWDTLPELALGFAGPFIGDEVFNQIYQVPFQELMGDKWKQIEAVNRYNEWDKDGTCEGYQVDSYPYLYINQNAICLLPTDHLSYSYGMHDLRNYQTGIQGNYCN